MEETETETETERQWRLIQNLIVQGAEACRLRSDDLRADPEKLFTTL